MSHLLACEKCCKRVVFSLRRKKEHGYRLHTRFPRITILSVLHWAFQVDQLWKKTFFLVCPFCCCFALLELTLQYTEFCTFLLSKTSRQSLIYPHMRVCVWVNCVA